MLQTEKDAATTYLNCSISVELWVRDTDHANAADYTWVRWESLWDKIKTKLVAAGDDGALANALMHTGYYLDKEHGYLSFDTTNVAIERLKASFPNPLQTAADGAASLQFKAYARVARSEVQGPEAALDQLKSAEFTVHFVDQAQADTCRDVTLQLSDVTESTGVEREAWLEFTLQTKAEAENGLATFTIAGRKISSTKAADCAIVSTCEMMGRDGQWQPFLGNEFCTVEMGTLEVHC